MIYLICASSRPQFKSHMEMTIAAGVLTSTTIHESSRLPEIPNHMLGYYESYTHGNEGRNESNERNGNIKTPYYQIYRTISPLIFILP